MNSSGKKSRHSSTCHSLVSTHSWPHHTLVRKACGDEGQGSQGMAAEPRGPHPAQQARCGTGRAVSLLRHIRKQQGRLSHKLATCPLYCGNRLLGPTQTGPHVLQG